MSSSSQPALPVTIVLSSPSDWDEWLAVVKSKALTAEIWQCIDPPTDKQKLKKALRTQEIETWIQQWEKTYQDCKDLKLANVEHDQPQYDFLHAISSISPEFANYWLINLESKAYEGTPLPNIYALIEQFWNSHRASSIRNKATHGTFPAIFQGKSAEETSQPQSQAQAETKKKPCLCGDIHPWKKC